MKEVQNNNDNPFALSIGDLMAALLLIFVLLLAATLLRLENIIETQTTVAEDYLATKENLIEALKEEFSEEFEKWGAELVEEVLLIRFNQNDLIDSKGPKFFWGDGDWELTEDHVEILSNFFPRYIEVLTREEFKDEILEIRIEGHTTNKWSSASEDSYLNNMKLSQDRTRSVLNFGLTTILNDTQRLWCQSRITANGLSFSRLLNKEDPGSAENRRVEFRIITNAEKQIDKILKLGKTE